MLLGEEVKDLRCLGGTEGVPPGGTTAGHLCGGAVSLQQLLRTLDFRKQGGQNGVLRPPFVIDLHFLLCSTVVKRARIAGRRAVEG